MAKLVSWRYVLECSCLARTILEVDINPETDRTTSLEEAARKKGWEARIDKIGPNSLIDSVPNAYLKRRGHIYNRTAQSKSSFFINRLTSLPRVDRISK